MLGRAPHLPYVEVEEASDLLLLVESSGLVLHLPDGVHLLQIVQHLIPSYYHLPAGGRV